MKNEKWDDVHGNTTPDDRMVAFLESPTDSYAILQLREDVDDNIPLMFANYSYLQKKEMEPEIDRYEVVYHGSISMSEDVNRQLEDLYVKFNIDHPDDFRGHSMSVSDIVALKVVGEVSFHYVDSVGFQKLENFMKSENYLKNAEMAMEDDYGMIDGMPLREYQTDMMQMPLVRQFITDDEVNADLTRGSGFSGGKARIYNYWQENHSAKEKMDFLKHEYGTGGHSHACSGATHSGQDHDAKGVAYTKSGCDKLQMSWAQVVQRIDGLIRKGRYLSPEEEAERQAIEEAKTDPLEDVYDRFAVIDTEDGEYAIWDNQTDDYYVDPEGVTEYFTDEWLANDYLEEVRQSVAAMESVQPEAPVAEPAEVVEASASEEPKWNYQVGDTVYLDDTAFRVEQITDREVQLRDPTLAYPIFRAENRENFERMLSQDERNHAVRVDAQTEEKPVTEDFLGKTEPRDYTPEYQLLDRLRMDCEYFLGAGQHSEKHLWAGNRHAQIAKMRELYEMIPDKPEWLTPEMINSYEERMAPRYLVAAYHHFENGFDDKLDYYTLEEAEKAAQGYVDGTMEDDGFKYDGAAVYDQQEHKCIRIYGDYPDEKAHAQVRASAEPEQQEPEHFIDHFYVAEDIQKRGALDIKEYSSFDDALRAYYALPDTQRKALGAMNTRDLPGSLDFVQCVDGKDTIIQDYAQVDGWQNAEVMDIIAQLEQSITTREIPPVPAVNFHITDDNIGEGGPKQKFARNIAAIETLFKLESENRNATTEEQEILSNYVGWGGLADAFDPDKGNWAKEYQTLKNLLSEDEYAAARASTLNAHYTSPTVIRSIYDAVGQMGFETGNILEPAMGIGNFFGMLPPEMQSSRLYGVELDSITGRIAQKLYPNAEIKVAGFETTDRRDFYDLAVGNVPFGNYKVSDKPYDNLGFSIHNYFFAKALDQVRPGGVVAFVTSRYTMDSKNSDARRYMAQRAELLGAIRLPNDAFKKNAGTEVVSDILFLQKRDHPIDIVPEWVNLDRTEEGHTMNSYFVAHPEMVLGDTVEESTAYGMDITVRPIEGMELSELLKEAVSHIQGTYQAVELPEADKGKEIETIPATPDVKNFSYTVVDGNVYFRENSLMRRVDLNEKAKDRVMGMVELRGIVNELIEYQLEDYPDEMITQKQAELNDAYDAFAAKNGLINNRANGQAFADDSSYYLLCSLENVDEDGNLKSKADMFTKRTIKPERRVTSVNTPSEALAISIGERGKVDLPFMAQLLGTPGEYDAIQAELRGVIFKDPMAPDAVEVGWQTADDYLSGDVRSKLRVAQMAADRDSSFHINVEALQKAQPKDLDASEIDVRLGATWIDADYIQQFMEETFETPYYLRRSIEVKFSELTAEWRINGKSSPNYNDVAAYVTYGTERANAYRILEETLNLKDIRIYDTIEDADGKQKRVLNKKETTLAQQKQQAIKDAFRDWIWRDPHRRETLSTKYNELFNSTRPREYDGSHIRFGGMNPDITLREHQRNAIAHVLYGGNTLLAHEVGAGKTFEMAASAMESKRLGLSQKSLFVVPNHLTLQWANEFLHLYPSAKLLVATKKDFETANRKKFCARIATGDYDAVIIGHSQFEKIPLSAERQERQLREQIDEIEGAIAELKWQRGENFTIKQMEKTRKSLEARLDKLLAADKKDDVITFEQLGVDRLFVDESHAFKNLFLYTKMRNVAGLSTSEAQKSSDMFMKCRYMDELTGGRGVIFATGTPVSNSMTELYTVMRYLQYSTLQQKNLTHFDSWASTFGETTTAIELAPEGTGYRARTRFAKFFNLPELMNMFKEVADIKTSDQLHEQESGTFIPPSAKTVNDLLDEYMSIYGVNTWAMSTYESRKSLIANYIRPLIGDMKLEDVTPRIMDKYYRDLLSVKAVSSKYVKARTEYLTPHTVREVHKTLRNAFNQAVKWELMTRNPVEHATLPKEEHKTRDIWTAEVLQKALEACDDDILRLAINLAFSCSLRMGELLGLTWDCIDISPTSIELGQASIFVEKELQRVNREAMADLDGKDIMFKFPPTFASTHTALVLKTPKTKTSVRKVFLPKTVAEMLVQRKADIEELKDLFGDEFVDFNLVFCSSNGKPIEGQVINRAFNKLIEEKGLPKVVFHSLRHSSITYKLKLNGGDMKSVQGDSGHAQVKMVADVYSHIIDDDRRLNAERMEAAFYSGRQATPEPVQPAATESSADDKELLLKLLQNPEMAALLKSLAKTL